MDVSSINSPCSNYDEERSAIIPIYVLPFIQISLATTCEDWQKLEIASNKNTSNETSVERCVIQSTAKSASHSVDSAIMIAHQTYYGHQPVEAMTLKGSPSDTAQVFIVMTNGPNTSRRNL